MSVSDQLNAMIAGTHEDVIDDTIEQEDGVDEETVEEETTDTVDIEDTDLDTESEEEEDTEDDADESSQETSDTEDDGEEEDSHETTDDKSEKTNVEPEGEKPAEVDYKKFYEEVALAKFTANGRQVEGFKNPEDLIRAQQMLHGYSDKMKVFKEYKKFLKPLEERGITADPDKFNLAMSLLDGDVEAIKKVIKDRGVDPLELDLEDIKYTPRNTLPSDAQLLVEEMSSQARDLGIEDKFHKVLTKDLDDHGINEFITNSKVRKDLMQHLQDGTYELVQDEIRNMELLSDGEYDSVNSIDKYRMAVKRLQAKYKDSKVNEQKTTELAKQKLEDDRIQREKELTAAEFKKKAAEKEAEAAEARRKAASVSKKRVVKVKTESVKPESLKGDEFRNYFRDMMMK